MADNYNPGFAFYENFFTSIEHLPLEEIKEDLYAIVKYGITGELVDKQEMPHGYSYVLGHKLSIDGSIKRWNNNTEKTITKIEKIKPQDKEIANLLISGVVVSDDIGAALTKPISGPAVRQKQVWKDFQNMERDEFCVRYEAYDGALKLTERKQNSYVVSNECKENAYSVSNEKLTQSNEKNEDFVNSFGF